MTTYGKFYNHGMKLLQRQNNTTIVHIYINHDENKHTLTQLLRRKIIKPAAFTLSMKVIVQCTPTNNEQLINNKTKRNGQ